MRRGLAAVVPGIQEAEGDFAAARAALASGQSIQLVGFGTFSVNERAARTGRR